MRTFSDLLKISEGEDVLLGTWSQIGAPEVIDILGTSTARVLIYFRLNSSTPNPVLKRTAEKHRRRLALWVRP